MKKKFLISIAIIIATIFSFSICFATDGLGKAADDVRNVVGGAENTVENAAKGISNTSKNATGAMENGMDAGTTRTGTNGNNDYNTTRVATGDTTIMGMNSNTWTWLIIGIAAIAIIAVVWYYSMQFTNANHNNHHDNNDRLD